MKHPNADIVHESVILKKLDESLREDDNQWPQIPLRDVVVYPRTRSCPAAEGHTHRGAEPINLLKANKTAGVCLEGTFHASDTPARSLLKARDFWRQRVVVTDVSVYSWGKYEDGTLAFWAAGEAGWFELRSAGRAYTAVYGEMEEVVCMLYYLADKASRARKDWSRAGARELDTHVKTVFKAFARSEHNQHAGALDGQECFDRFVQNRDFLIKCMLEGAEGVDWEAGPFLRWFVKEHPGDVASIANIVNQSSGSATAMDIDEEVDAEEEYELSVTPKQRRTSNRAERQAEPEAVAGRRSKRLAEQYNAATEEEGLSSEELSRRRGRRRGKHKRKSMLRLKGGKTPNKSNLRRENLRAYSRPTRRQLKDDSGFEEQADSEEDLGSDRDLKPATVTGLQFTEANEEDEPEPMEEYMTPKGPGDTWTCPYDGCNHQVWDARAVTGKALIKQHYARTHQDSIEALIKSESRPWAKVSYLLEKVRNMQAQGQNPGKDGFPTPIARKY